MTIPEPEATGGTTFGPDVVSAVRRHMNDDHAEDCLLICRGLGGQPQATAARMSGMDDGAMEFLATVDGRETLVRVPFRERLTERRQIRAEAARMYREACVALGISPRPGTS